MVGYGPTLKGWAPFVWKVFACRGCSCRIKNAQIFSDLGTLILTQFSGIAWSLKNNCVKDQTIFRKSSRIMRQKELSCFSSNTYTWKWILKKINIFSSSGFGIYNYGTKTKQQLKNNVKTKLLSLSRVVINREEWKKGLV